MNCRLTVALVLAACVGTLHSATLERLSLDDLITKSTSIVRGKVTDTWTAFGGRDIFTHYRIQVTEQFKGSPQKTVEVSVPGGTVGDLHQTVAGSPILHTGDEFVFFLWTSQGGVTWITGLTQGLFALGDSATSDPTATRTASRELMLDPDTARPVKDTPYSLRLSDLRSRISARLAKGAVQ